MKRPVLSLGINYAKDYQKQNKIVIKATKKREHMDDM
jgi:hypothetical protein